jgi:diguanylate cyclase
MFVVYNCLATKHDLRLVSLAVIICLLASFTAVSLMRHVRKSAGRSRGGWLVISAVATGFGIWSTHFIAMLAFSPGIASGYNFPLTLLSLVGGIVVTGMGLFVAVSERGAGMAWLGGAIVGGGVAIMHFTGIAAYEVEGRFLWEARLVAASILFGALLGAAALKVALLRDGMWSRIGGALLLTAAICGLHFTAMGAIAILPDPSIHVSPSALPAAWFAVAVALASFIIIVFTLIGLALDIRDQRRCGREADRMRGLANAAVEGLVVCWDEMIATANNSFVALVGADENEVIGRTLDAFFPEATLRAVILACADQPIEASLRRSDGSIVPVELIARRVDFVGEPHRAIAVRDLRFRKQAEQHIRYLAYHDALTGLSNRRDFFDKLDLAIDAARESGRRVGLLCLDLDHFKEVNDLSGHAAGDRMLQAVVRVVSAQLASDQTMARLGGDEFAIILPALADPDEVGLAAQRILDAMRAENDKPDREMALSASIGAAIWPKDADDGKALLSNADMALYCVKTEGRGGYRFYEAPIGAKVHDRFLLEQDLRQAVAHGELRVVYQPQLNIKSNEIIGFEVLLRWRHATRGDISPAVCVPIAEESGQILEIGEWVLQTACREAAGWSRPLKVAVNVSAVQLHNPNFVQRVHEILFETGMAPGRLELEITETALIRDMKRALAALRQLKALGIKIAMDDFGTGYSSLSNLRAFPFDKIKIDTSFVRAVDKNRETATIVTAVLGLGRGLGLPVLAEGVERPEELQFLADHGCDEAQGYLIGRPAEIAHFHTLTSGGNDVVLRLPAPSAAIAFEAGRRAANE